MNYTVRSRSRKGYITFYCGSYSIKAAAVAQALSMTLSDQVKAEKKLSNGECVTLKNGTKVWVEVQA